MSFIEKVIGFDRSKLILELACSAGDYSLELSRRGYLTVGIDDGEERLLRARQCAEREGLTAQFVRGGVHSLIYKAQFDVALLLCSRVFGLGLDEEADQEVLKKVAAALKPKGVVIMRAINGACAGTRAGSQHAYTQAELGSLLQRCGFTNPRFFVVTRAGYGFASVPSAHDLELGVMAEKRCGTTLQQVLERHAQKTSGMKPPIKCPGVV